MEDSLVWVYLEALPQAARLSRLTHQPIALLKFENLLEANRYLKQLRDLNAFILFCSALTIIDPNAYTFLMHLLTDHGHRVVGMQA